MKTSGSQDYDVIVVGGGNANREAYGIYKAVGVYRSTEMMFYPATRGKKAAGAKAK